MPVLVLATALASWGSLTDSSRADEGQGTLVTGVMPASTAGIPVDYTAYLPAGYEAGTERFASLYLLHGRGDSMAAWPRMKSTLDEMIGDGQIPPVVVIMPDAPWSERGNYYVNSDFDGSATLPAGAAVETAMTRDLVAHVDATYRTVATRDARAVGGYSMGGYGALRYALAHEDTYAAGLILSPAVYIPTPPDDSSAREFGAFGTGGTVFDEAIYEAKNYPALLPELDPATSTHLFIAVGDDEWMNPDPADADHDLDFEAARLYNTVRRSDAVTAELRVLNGGHDWDVWGPAFREGLLDVMSRVRTTEPALLDGSLLGTTGDDRAGGILTSADGGDIVALSIDGEFGNVTPQGRLDGLVIARDAAGATQWMTSLATTSNDRIYGIEAAPGGDIHVAGYTAGDLDGEHGSAASDDAFGARLTGDGAVSWITQFGDPAAADRVYATAPANDGGLLVAGYTKGSLAGEPNAGDKDAFFARLTPSGDVAWINQFGGVGEDKALAIVQGVDGKIQVGGMTSANMPGTTNLGEMDGWLGSYTADGAQLWLQPVGTSSGDQVSALAMAPDGNILMAGHTGGVMGDASAGANDAFLRKVAADGSTVWTTQVGSPGDDRATDVTVNDAGAATIVGHTDGRIDVSAGGTDVFSTTLDAAGQVLDQQQVGTPERDGADVWDEGNLYVSLRADGDLALTGLTYGSSTTVTNSGEGDVFVTTLEHVGQDQPNATPTPSASSEPTPSPSATRTSPVPTPSPSWTTSEDSSGDGETDLYSTPGLHHVNGRWWFTQCESYSQTVRCLTEIRATQVRNVGGEFVKEDGWFFNNLTYLPLMKRGQWAGNPLGRAGTWTSTEGRKWRTECDTPRTGGNGCRSSIWSNDVVATALPGGGYSYGLQWRWVFNNIVRFK